MKHHTESGVSYYSFESFDAASGVRHLFSTRAGGVSTGVHSSMNLSLLNGDCPQAVEENFRRIAVLGYPPEGMVFSQQTHECYIRVVSDADRGKGTMRDRDYTGIDGLVTNVANITLATFYADCVPLYFYDPAMRAIGLSHAGWRGTVGQIGAAALAAMTQNYGSNPADVLVGIGPSICAECFEVGDEVVAEFVQRLPWSTDFIKPCAKHANKSYIDLQGINRQSLIYAGVLAKNIELPGICTKENPEIFFSHRVMGTQRGTLTALLQLK